jgi:hypothetical protein
MQSIVVTYEPTYRGLPIQARPGFGLRTEILDVLHELFSQTMDRFQTFAAVMLDIRIPPDVFFSDSDRSIRRFISGFIEGLKQQGIGALYIWVRKHPDYSSDAHYVAVLLLDARYGQNPDLHLAQANALWAEEVEVAQSNGMIHYCGLEGAPRAAPVLIVRRDRPDFQGSCGRCFATLSRVAHVETSGGGSDDAAAFGSSLPS